MSDFDDLGTDDLEFEDDDMDFEDDDDVIETDDDVEVEESDEDPWSWAKEEGVDPNAVKKTWNQYTQTREEALRERDEATRLRQELEPFMKLRDEIMEDPGLVKAIDNYFANERPADREIQDVKSELMAVKNQIMTERELADVQGWVSSQGYPPVKDEEVLRHAVENGIANLKSAYKDLMFETIQDMKADKMAKGIQRSRGAKSTRTKKTDSGKPRISTSDISTMSDDDFIKNYDKLLEKYK